MPPPGGVVRGQLTGAWRAAGGRPPPWQSPPRFGWSIGGEMQGPGLPASPAEDAACRHTSTAHHHVGLRQGDGLEGGPPLLLPRTTQRPPTPRRSLGHLCGSNSCHDDRSRYVSGLTSAPDRLHPSTAEPEPPAPQPSRPHRQLSQSQSFPQCCKHRPCPHSLRLPESFQAKRPKHRPQKELNNSISCCPYAGPRTRGTSRQSSLISLAQPTATRESSVHLQVHYRSNVHPLKTHHPVNWPERRYSHGLSNGTKPEILRPQGDTTAYTIRSRLNPRCGTMAVEGWCTHGADYDGTEEWPGATPWSLPAFS
ncbi:uncharacterized protein [Vicugna pacos]|uniref:Uncharacterized protein isoform X3 n=1 Tax=Vicugna pacos TaxID=30538 RepID=A0ABM5CKT1_VICPA